MSLTISNLRISTKILLAFSVLILGCAGLLLVTMQTLASYQDKSVAFDRRFDRVAAIKDLQLAISQEQRLLLASLLLQGDALSQNEKNLTDSHGRLSQFLSVIAQTKGLRSDVDILIDKLEQSSRIYAQTVEGQIFPILKQGKIADARPLILGVAADTHVLVRQTADELVSLTTKVVQQDIIETREEFIQLRTSLLIFGVAIVFVGIVLAWGLSQHIAKPLAVITELAEKIGRGELSAEVQRANRHDEVGRLFGAFNEMSRYLRELVHELNEGINVLASSSEEILAVTNQVAGSTQETATAITEIATTVEEVKQTAVVTGAKSQAVLESTVVTRQEAQLGRQSVAETLKGMEQIREQMQSVGESIMRLGEQSQAIGEIVSTVADLAEQSNLLGVNASIEAAKAGEAGRGFSVVAQEVKALAEQSKQATAQVRGILTEVQRSMTKAVLLAEQSSKSVDSGYEKAQQSGEVIQSLRSRVEDNSEVAVQIAASSQQQRIGMDQIAQAMESIRVASQDNVAGARQVDQAAKSLNQLGQRMQSLSRRFKL